MSQLVKSSRDVIVRTQNWDAAVHFYEKTLGFSVIHRSETIVGFDTGAFILYVEAGESHGPVFDFLTPDVQGAKKRLVDAGCTLIEEDASVPRCYLKDPFGIVFNLGIRDSGTSR
jgi:catechol 2,3-dioxygenase-like lactoylglutathione lyase family enzyme